VAQTEEQLLREKTSRVSDQIAEVKRAHCECGQRLKARDGEAKDAAKLKMDRSKLVADARGRLTQVAEEMDQLSQEVGMARVKAEEAKATFEQEHHRGRLIKAVYEQSKAGRLKGVHGRLGDLGTINKKYDVAVSTACGLLDAIIVDTTEDAQAVIQFVRQHDLGRTTCISLDKINEKEQEMLKAASLETPEGAPLLFDLIKPSKPEYKVAYFFALTHTLVAKDLDQATRIGLQGGRRWRVVTLPGQLIDTSGTMSGGGHNVQKGGMRASLCNHSPDEVRALVEAYDKANTRLTAIRQERRALEEALELTEKEISEFDLREKKCEMDISSYRQQMEAYDARLQTMKVPTLSGEEKTKLKDLEKLINSRSDELNDIHAKHGAVEQEVQQLHHEIMNIGGEELSAAKWKVEEATKRCDNMRRDIRKMSLDAENMDKNSKKADEAALVAAKEHESTGKALAQLREEHARLDDKAESVLNAYNTLKESLIGKDQLLTRLKTQRDEVLEAAKQMKSQEVDLVAEMERKTNLLRDLYARITGWGNKLKETRQEYAQLPLDLLDEIRGPDGCALVSLGDDGKAKPVGGDRDMGRTLGRRAIQTDISEEDLAAVQKPDIDARMLALEATIKNMKPNLGAIEEFRRADGEHKTKLSEFEAVHTEREAARRELEGLRQKRLEEFMEGFSVISMKLKEMYQMITLGGDAELELVDTLDPFSEGILFSVRPPKKSWKQISNLSGGEKTLASLSLVFALHHYRPTPLYFMDEIDAALDFRNVSIIANYVKERTKNAQFIIISLRNHMFELADLLVGIYKTNDQSKSVAINPVKFVVDRRPLQERPSNEQTSRTPGTGIKRPLTPTPLDAQPTMTTQQAKRSAKEN